MKLKKVRGVIAPYERDSTRVIVYDNAEMVESFWISNQQKYQQYKDYIVKKITSYQSSDGVSLLGILIDANDKVATK